jgi:valyl-tRNA synthetase
VKKVWEWKENYGGKICNQIRCLGSSVDWSREAFTMDANLSAAVTEAFVRFHEDGLLYRDTRLVNWSCSLKSAISDIEVDYLDLEGRTFLAVPNHKLKDKYEFGMITSFAYKVAPECREGLGEHSDELVVATTRLETMLGDTAVAVHPDDPRYTHLHGKFLVHPFLERRIPVITDGVLVDMSFGTGAVKVTPAHDPNDYTCGKRNNLEFITVLTEEGKIAANGGKYAGMMRYDARLAMEKDLEEMGQFRGKAPNPMRLGVCSRSGDIVEPMLTPQWYLSCASMAKRSVDAVRSGELKIVPQMHESTWYGWLDNIRCDASLPIQSSACFFFFFVLCILFVCFFTPLWI